MNRGLKSNLRILWAFVLAIAVAGSLCAQDITGSWEGTITTPQGTLHRIILRVIHGDNGAFKARIYSIDQDFTGDWVDSMTVHDSTVQFAVGNPCSLTKSSFGQWVVRCQRLAKTTRQMLSDKDQRGLIVDLYRADPEKVEGLTKKEIYASLYTVSEYRNRWVGHSGIVSTKEHERRLSLLQEELTRLRGALGGVFEDWWLVKPNTNTYTRGVYKYHAARLMGSRQIFKQETIETSEVMDENELYCYDNVTRRPLELLHFVRMMPAPDNEEIACYFFNRLEGQGVRWVSYHFEREAERIEADVSVLRQIEEAEDSGINIRER